MARGCLETDLNRWIAIENDDRWVRERSETIRMDRNRHRRSKLALLLGGPEMVTMLDPA